MRHAETPKPIKARPVMTPARVWDSAKIKAPVPAKARRKDSTSLGPSRQAVTELNSQNLSIESNLFSFFFTAAWFLDYLRIITKIK